MDPNWLQRLLADNISRPRVKRIHSTRPSGAELKESIPPGLVAQSVTSMTIEPGVTSLILARSHTFVEIDHEMISTAVLLLLLIQEVLLSVTRQNMCTKYWLTA